MRSLSLLKIPAAASALALCLAAAGLPTSTSRQEPLARAKQLYERHDYKQALEVIDEFLATSPEQGELRAAGRLRALSLCKLPDADGWQYAERLMAEHAPFANDADLWQAMGEEKFVQWDRSKAYKAYEKAAGLYEGQSRAAEAADAYLKAIECLESGGAGLVVQAAETQPTTQPWRAEIDRAFEIADHVAAMEVDAARKAEALLLAGRASRREGSWEYASKGIERLRRAAEEFAQTPAAPQAQWEIGQTCEQFSRYVEAVAAFRKVITDFTNRDLAKDAKQRIDAIKSPRVEAWVIKPYLPGQRPEIYWAIRNVKMLKLSAWTVDLKAAVEAFEPGWDIIDALRNVRGPEAASWTFTTPDAGDYQPHRCAPEGEEKQTTLPIPVPLSETGAYLVCAEGVNPDGKMAGDWCLVVLSNISAVAKLDGDQTLLFVCEAQSGAPAAAEVAVARRRNSSPNTLVVDHRSGKTDDAGLAEMNLPQCLGGAYWIAAARRGDDQAICAPGSFHWRWWGPQEQYKVYGFTERPVYRPGQVVHFKEILRRHSDGQYFNVPSAKVRVEIRDPKNQTIYSADHVTDGFGALEGDIAVAEAAPLGVYQIVLKVGGDEMHPWTCPGNRFRVEEYKKPEFKVEVEAARADYRVGEEMKIKIASRYYFGQPVAGATVNFRIRKQSYEHRFDSPRPWGWYREDLLEGRWWPWWRPQFDELVADGATTADANGEAFVTVQAEPIKGHEELDLKFLVEAEVTDASRRVINGRGEVKVTHAPFFVHPRPAQAVYGPGDSVEIEITTENPNGQPVAGAFDVEAWRIERIRKGVVKAGKEEVEFEEKLAQKVHSSRIDIPATGRGSLRFTPDMTGQFKVIVRQAEAKEAQKPVQGDCEFWIAPKTGAEEHYAYNDLQIVPAADQYEIGQTMKLLVNAARPGGYVWLTGEADEILFSRVIHISGNSQLVEIPIEAKLCPNFTLQAMLLRDDKLYRDEKKIVVPPTHRFIKVATSLDKGDMGGGEGKRPPSSDTLRVGDLNKFQPREKTVVNVKLTDVQTGRPLVGQVTLFMVDSSVYYIQPEFREAIEKAFYGRVRPVLVSTADSFAGPAELTGRHDLYRGRRERAGLEARAGLFADRAGAPAQMLAEAKGMGAGEEGPPLAEAVVREFFKDTVLWAGSVVTDADGAAQVPVTMPDQLTTFALHAIAVDADTRVGQSRADVVTTKNIIVRLESGRFFTEGDRGYVTVIVHNYFDSPQELKIDLSADEALALEKVNLGGKWQPYQPGQALDVTVQAGSEARLDFLTHARRPGDVKLTARARGKRESDALQLTLPIVPWGASKIESKGGVLGQALVAGTQPAQAAGAPDEARFDIEVPGEIKPGSQSLTITLNPSIVAVALDALPYLAQYPYGCVEQTMSRFLPTVLMHRTLQQAGINLEDVRKRIEQQSAADPKLAAKYKLLRERMDRNPVYSSAQIDKMVAAGLKRLAEFQHPDGSWGWWKDDAGDAYMTAYVLMGLALAQECDVKLPEGMIQRAHAWLVERVSRPKAPGEGWWYRHQDNDNTRVFALYSISRADPNALRQAKLKAELARLYEQRDGLTDYGRAYLALALHAAGRIEEAAIVVGNFDNTVQVDAKTDSACWGGRGSWWYWYDGPQETTAWVLQAMLAVCPDGKYVPMAANWLAANRRELAWGNTKATAMAVYALARYSARAGELDCDQTIQVCIDGSTTHTVSVNKDNFLSFDDRITVPADQLAPGRHNVSIRRSGTGRCYWMSYLRYYTTAETISGGGNQLAVRRRYFKLVPETFTNTRTVWKDGKTVEEQFPDMRYVPQPLEPAAEIASGELIEVRLAIRADNDLEYLLFEDPKPAGCEPQQLVSGYAHGSPTYANMELRDTKVVFFTSMLSRGEHELSYRLRCEQPGTFRILPADGEAMYSPFVEAISDSGKLTITTGPGK